jgi:hypothetical protein
MGRGEEEALERVGAAEVQKEEALEIDRPDLLSHLIGEGREGEGEEVR